MVAVTGAPARVAATIGLACVAASFGSDGVAQAVGFDRFHEEYRWALRGVAAAAVLGWAIPALCAYALQKRTARQAHQNVREMMRPLSDQEQTMFGDCLKMKQNTFVFNTLWSAENAEAVDDLRSRGFLQEAPPSPKSGERAYVIVPDVWNYLLAHGSE